MLTVKNISAVRTESFYKAIYQKVDVCLAGIPIPHKLIVKLQFNWHTDS